MSASSGQDIIPFFDWFTCLAVIDEGEPTEHVCTFEGNADGWVDPEINSWGWNCPPREFGGCGKQHQYEGLDSWRNR